jgi:hypothetical protein
VRCYVVTVQPTNEFSSLGGDSESAGQTVGVIRFKGEKINLPHVSILDLYTHRKPKALEEDPAATPAVKLTVPHLSHTFLHLFLLVTVLL